MSTEPPLIIGSLTNDLFEKYSALDSNKAIFIHTHPTLSLVHIRLIIPRTVKKEVGVSNIAINHSGY